MIGNFWSNETGILKSRISVYNQSVSISSQRKKPYNQLPYGVAQVVVADSALYHKIMAYIEGIKKIV